MKEKLPEDRHPHRWNYLRTDTPNNYLRTDTPIDESNPQFR
jgi:hypothetical protein